MNAAILPSGPVVIAIPARDEQAHIGDCLTALAEQVGARADHIVLFVNNTTDRTVAEARLVEMPPRTRLHITEITLPPTAANAGQARRLAMQEAARLAGPRGVLLSTDADSRADPEWLFANLAALAAGCDAVAGWVDLDPEDWMRIPLALHAADARESAYARVCDEIEWLLDPDPHDPWPRHTQHSGASIAVTARAFAAVGGIPEVASSEDRAFFARLREIDARIRHSQHCHVVVSGRTAGRAVGGMADTIRRRLAAPDDWLDDRLEPAAACAARALLRARFRRCFARPEPMDDLACRVGLDPLLLALLMERRHFGAAWAAVQAASPVLARQRVRALDLPREMAEATRIRDGLRASLGDDDLTAQATGLEDFRSHSRSAGAWPGLDQTKPERKYHGPVQQADPYAG